MRIAFIAQIFLTISTAASSVLAAPVSSSNSSALQRRDITPGDLTSQQHHDQAGVRKKLADAARAEAAAHQQGVTTSLRHAEQAVGTAQKDAFKKEATEHAAKGATAEHKAKMYDAEHDYHDSMGKAAKAASEAKNLAKDRGNDHLLVKQKLTEMEKHHSDARGHLERLNQLKQNPPH
ncbi:hypothetical protein FRC17_010550 [Serendipita sp. 399]|nr:hypothetical protein FRC17_010550 [Serendipita sp. 399]